MMTNRRTMRSTITFATPFRLKGVQQPQAAGTYKVDTDEELIEGMRRTVYRPVATRLYLRVGGSIRIRTVDRQDLRAAWDGDRIVPTANGIPDRTFLEGSAR